MAGILKLLFADNPWRPDRSFGAMSADEITDEVVSRLQSDASIDSVQTCIEALRALEVRLLDDVSRAARRNNRGHPPQQHNQSHNHNHHHNQKRK